MKWRLALDALQVRVGRVRHQHLSTDPPWMDDQQIEKERRVGIQFSDKDLTLAHFAALNAAVQ